MLYFDYHYFIAFKMLKKLAKSPTNQTTRIKILHFKFNSISEETMTKRITIRLNKRLSELFERLEESKIYNRSELIRKAIERYLADFIAIDNSEHLEVLEKDEQ